MPRMTIGHTKCKCQSACAIIIHKFPSYSSWFFFVGFLVYFHIIIILNIRKEQRAHSFKRYGIKYFIMKRKKKFTEKVNLRWQAARWIRHWANKHWKAVQIISVVHTMTFKNYFDFLIQSDSTQILAFYMLQVL